MNIYDENNAHLRDFIQVKVDSVHLQFVNVNSYMIGSSRREKKETVSP